MLFLYNIVILIDFKRATFEDMLSPEERKLILGILLLLLLGTGVRSCRNRVTTEIVEKEEIPELKVSADLDASAD